MTHTHTHTHAHACTHTHTHTRMHTQIYKYGECHEHNIFLLSRVRCDVISPAKYPENTQKQFNSRNTIYFIMH